MDDCFAESLVYSESDNSEVEDATKSPHIPEYIPGAENASNEIENQLQESKVSDESDEDDFNKSIRKKKNNARILSSDDEMSNDQTLDSHEVKNLTNVRPSICDSDTKSSSDEDKIEENTQTNKMIKKLKKKKQKVCKISENSQTNSDGSSGDEEKIAKKPHRIRSSSNQSSNSSSSDSNSNDNTDSTQNIEPREKPVQRVVKLFR